MSDENGPKAGNAGGLSGGRCEPADDPIGGSLTLRQSGCTETVKFQRGRAEIPFFSTWRGDTAQERPPVLTKFLHFCDISRLRQEVSLFDATGV